MAKIVAAVVLLLGSLGLGVGGRDAAAAGKGVAQLGCILDGGPRLLVAWCSESTDLNTACPTSTSADCAQTLANFLSADNLKINSTTVVPPDLLLYTLIR